MDFTFTTPDNLLWQHRSPDLWLEDMIRFVGYDGTVEMLEAETTDVISLRVTGEEDALRFALVALNLHAEQTPWDSTPTDQAQALEGYLAAQA